MTTYRNVVFFLFFHFALYSGHIGITYKIPQGRLGDQLFTFCKAQWLAYHYNISLYYHPYKYFNELELVYKEKVYNKKLFANYKIVYVKNMQDFVNVMNTKNNENILIQIDMYFVCDDWQSDDNKNYVIYPYNIKYTDKYCERGLSYYRVQYDACINGLRKNERFLDLLRTQLQPIKNNEFVIPQDKITVAVHVRKGGGFDKPYYSIQEYPIDLKIDHYLFITKGKKDNFFHKINKQIQEMLKNEQSNNCLIESITYKTFQQPYIDLTRPLKHPPDQFYIDQIKAISAIFNDALLYVYIFTDDLEPESIVRRYKKAINKENIIFDFRKDENNHYSNVIEDLYHMSKFDILIRPYSSFSVIAQIIGDHKLVLSPKHGIWLNNILIIDEVLLYIKDNVLKKN